MVLQVHYAYCYTIFYVILCQFSGFAVNVKTWQLLLIIFLYEP